MLRFDGLIRSLFPYLRTVAPRKSNPSSIDVIFVFSFERRRPRSSRKASIAGCTLCSSLFSRTACYDKVIRVAHHVDLGAEVSLAMRVRLQGHRFEPIQNKVG